MKYGISIIGILLIGSGAVWWGTSQKKTDVPITQIQQIVPEKENDTSSKKEAVQEPKKTSIKNIKTKNGMEIKITKEGVGAEITNGAVAVVQYKGMFLDGTVFDATSLRGNTPFEFKLGAGQVIKGWDQGVLGMKVGEQRTLTIPADLAYGPQGIPGAIPPNATLVFEVTLEGIK